MTVALPAAHDKPAYVNRMFAGIASQYDRLNLLMTLGQDRRWRQEALALCDMPPRGRLLDVGTGTGAVARAAHAMLPAAEIVATDFTWEMVQVGRAQRDAGSVLNALADTLALPFSDNQFDATISSFVMRNIADRPAAFREQVRVTRRGGRVVCLETAPPHTVALEPLFRLYFFRIVPFLGGFISGNASAYAYLPASTLEFPAPDTLARMMELAGLHNVVYTKLMFGSVAIHVGTK